MTDKQEKMNALLTVAEEHAKVKVPEPLRTQLLTTTGGGFFPSLILGSSFGGSSKRDVFAAFAMAGLADPCSSWTETELATKAVACADALIAALGD